MGGDGQESLQAMLGHVVGDVQPDSDGRDPGGSVGGHLVVGFHPPCTAYDDRPVGGGRTKLYPIQPNRTVGYVRRG